MGKAPSIAFSLAVLSCCVSAAAQDRPLSDYVAAVEGAQSEPGPNGLGSLTIEELMDRFNVPGVSIAVIRDFEIHWAKGYGIADVETGDAVETDTLFQAGSISKPVAAMGVLKAVQDGVFSLDDDINDILTSWHLDTGDFTRDRPVTPRTLTSHTSGLGDGFGFPGYDPAGPIPTVLQILEGAPPSNTRRLFMERPPMSLMEYSGGGVTLMQQALEDARGEPFEDVLRDDVLLPIGMINSTYENPLPAERDRNAARGHDQEGRSRGPKWHVYPEMAAAGLWTTASDLALFAIEVQKSAVGKSNKVLNRAMVQEMLTPVGVGDFAVGFNIQKLGQGWYFGHGGSDWGFQADLIAHKVHGYGLAVMTNSDRGGAVMQELRQRVQRAYEWDSLALPAPRGYDPPPDFEEIELPAKAQAPAPATGLVDPSPPELQARVAGLARDVGAAEALRTVKRLQWAYGHYSEFGLWHDFADLFADTGIGHYVQGDLNREEIRALFLEQVGQGQLGLAHGRIYPHISFSPVLSLAEDGRAARGRFRILAMLGGYGGNATWFHGVYENAYVSERGVWKINEVSNAAQVSGTFAAGLVSQVGSAPAIAFHYVPGDVGRTVFAPPVRAGDAGAAGATRTAAAETDLAQLRASLSALEQRLGRLEDEAAVLRLQHQYGYYLDRHDWDALAALFAEQGSFEPGLRGVYVGRASVRRALNQFGDAPLPPGTVDDHILFQPYVSVAPDGRSAKVRVDQLGLHGTPGISAQWTQGIYENTFIKEDGEWRIRTLRYYPRLITDYARGWGEVAEPAPGPSAAFPPDAPPSESYGVYPEFHIPAFHFAHPVTGRPPQYPEGDPAIGRELGFARAGQEAADASAESGFPDRLADSVENSVADGIAGRVVDGAVDGVADSLGSLADWEARLVAAEARVQRTLGYDAVENLIGAFAFYLDECMIPDAAALFAEAGEIRIADGVPGVGSEGITNTLLSAHCPASRRDEDMTLHHVSQPVIMLADDGATASFAARLWEVHVSIDDESFYRGGMLEGEARFDDGGWRLAELDTRYIWTAPIIGGSL